MTFPLNVYLPAFLGALLTTFVTLPLWRRWCRSSGLVDEPGHRKIHSEPIPLAGGLAVFVGMAAPLLVAVVVASAHRLPASALPLTHGLGKRGSQLAVIMLGALGMLILGWWDDKRELPPIAKLAGQILIAAAVATSGVRITLFIPNVAISFALTILWILTVTNALNFMDNMNGLCTGLGVIGCAWFALSAAIAGQYLVALLALLASGALLGFLPYNFPKASAFLGDSGSHLVGYLLAILAILPHYYTADHPSAVAVLVPLLILAVPLGDLVWVVLLRLRLGKPFYVGDTNHLSHRLVRRGLSQRTAVLIIWLIAAVTGSIPFW